MATPDVSFVVIGFNESAHVAECVTSILAQDQLGSSEVLVVDDGSTDTMAAVTETLAAAHPEVRLVRHEVNRGRGAARRTGQDQSHASEVAFIDADITLPHDWLARARAGLASADAISGVAVPDGDCAVIWRMFGPRPKGMVGDWALTGNNVLIRRSALDKVGWPAERRRAEDNRMARALLDAGFTVTTLKDLRVEHHEAKTYRRTLAHVWGTGYHSTEILRDLRRFRRPDLVWTCWLVASVASIALAAAGAIPWWAPGAVIVGLTLAVDAGAMLQRFYLTPNPLRWLGAAIANLPMMTAYLVARSVFSPRLLLRRSRAGG